MAWEPRVRCVLVDVVTGGSLTPRDRVALAKAKLLAKPSAVLVESRLTRSILTAVSWLGGNMARSRQGRWTKPVTTCRSDCRSDRG